MRLQQRLERESNIEAEQSLHRDLSDPDLGMLIADRSSEDEHDGHFEDEPHHKIDPQRVDPLETNDGAQAQIDHSESPRFRGRKRTKSITVTLQDLASVLHRVDRNLDGTGSFVTPYDDRLSVYRAMSMVSDLESERRCPAKSECRSRAETSWTTLPRSPQTLKRRAMSMSSRNNGNGNTELADTMQYRLLLYDEEIRQLKKQNKMLINTHWELRKYWNMERVKYKQHLEEIQQQKKSFVLSFMFK